MNILNKDGVASEEAQKPPEELGRFLQRSMLQMKAEYMAEDGRGVDYAQLASSDLFAQYVKMVHQLVDCDPTPLPEQDRMAFFISILSTIIFVAKFVPIS